MSVLSFANNRSGQKVLCRNTFIPVMAAASEFEDPLQPGDKDLEREAARTGREKKMQEARLILARIRSAIRIPNLRCAAQESSLS